MRVSSSHHLYVHVPFCRLVCAYCDFVTVGGRVRDLSRYTDALLAELRLRPAGGELRTIYFGGGTPSLLPAEDVARLIDAAIAHWTDVALEEVTLEANPSVREAPDWRGLRAAGVTRLSLGVQALRDADLATLARGHSVDEARSAYAAARAAGFDSVSIDLIYGIPGQTLHDWETGLDAAVELGPDHVSLYALSLALAPDEWAAPPRAGALRWRRRMAQHLDDDLAAQHYALAGERLADAGYCHYELSSWARPGHEALHNTAYWLRRPYTGIGAGAHSYDGARERSWNPRDLDRYLRAVEAGERPTDGTERLDEATRAFEAIALGLRRIDGVSRAAFAAEFGDDPALRFADACADAASSGLLAVSDETLRLTPRGRMLASEALIGFLPAAAADALPA
jgi:oxygen-independent coproporphyrinogen-3 oxidase